jgi:hypothetical protein
MDLYSMRGGLEGIEAVVMLRSGRLSDWPEIASPAFQFMLCPQGVIFMRLVLKVVSILGTIVLKLSWTKSKR